jgi:hypothetical protein
MLGLLTEVEALCHVAGRCWMLRQTAAPVLQLLLPLPPLRCCLVARWQLRLPPHPAGSQQQQQQQQQ